MKRKEMWCIYIAGKYSDDNVLGMLRNMRKGMRKASRLLGLGFAPFCPWLDYQLVLNSDAPEAFSVEDFYAYSMEWLRRSDAVLCLPDWEDSHGARMEVDEAKKLGIPVFTNVLQMTAFFDEKESKIPGSH